MYFHARYPQKRTCMKAQTNSQVEGVHDSVDEEMFLIAFQHLAEIYKFCLHISRLRKSIHCQSKKATNIAEVPEWHCWTWLTSSLLIWSDSSHLHTLCLECLQSGSRSMSQRSSGPQRLPSFPRHLCMPMPMHNAVAPTLSIHTVSPSSPDPSHPKRKKTTNSPRYNGILIGVVWMIFAECCDRFNHASVIFAAHQSCQKQNIQASYSVPSQSRHQLHSTSADLEKSKSDTQSLPIVHHPQGHKDFQQTLGIAWSTSALLGHCLGRRRLQVFSQVNRMWFHGSKSTRSVTRYSKNRGL